ncbi:MAG: holo-[acyl-carrier-protein] synthase [Nitrospiraceae bacterium]|nr:MAG: holo-[acyl-carrier-protein] synthase [Nitrospiraceae bacterium]
MMELYQGIDMVQVSKFRDVFRKHTNFASDIFTEKEREYCETRKDPHIHFAGRFAVKEAALKALGIGMSGSGIDHAFQEIETIPGASGKPLLGFSGWVEKISRKRGIRQITVSISHSGDYAVASVILVKENNV